MLRSADKSWQSRPALRNGLTALADRAASPAYASVCFHHRLDSPSSTPDPAQPADQRARREVPARRLRVRRHRGGTAPRCLEFLQVISLITVGIFMRETPGGARARHRSRPADLPEHRYRPQRSQRAGTFRCVVPRGPVRSCFHGLSSATSRSPF